MKRKLFDLFRVVWKPRFMEKLLVRLTNGKEFGTTVSKFPPNHYDYKVRSIRKATRDGINYELDLSDIVDWFIYYGFKEKARLKLYSYIKPDQVIFDVGTNVGDVCLHAAKMVGEKGSVHSFEPDVRNFRRLIKNISLNSFSNIIPNRKGLGNESGTFRIYTVDETNKGMNRILHEEQKGKQFNEIEVITIDRYVIEKGISKLDLIKIDVEGFEMNVLKGASNSLEAFHPILFIELDDNNLSDQGSNAKELVNFLEQKSYSIIHADTNQSITSTFDFTNCHFDIVAQHNA